MKFILFWFSEVNMPLPVYFCLQMNAVQEKVFSSLWVSLANPVREYELDFCICKLEIEFEITGMTVSSTIQQQMIKISIAEVTIILSILCQVSIS